MGIGRLQRSGRNNLFLSRAHLQSVAPTMSLRRCALLFNNWVNRKMKRHSIAITLTVGLTGGICSVVAQDRPPTSREEYWRLRGITPPRKNEPPATAEQMKSTSFGRAQLRDVSDSAFVSINHSMLPKRVNGSMYSWAETLFSPTASPIIKGRPLEAGKMIVRAFAAFNPRQNDLIEYRWEHEGLNIRFLASINVLQIEVDLGEIERFSRYRMPTVDYLRMLLSEIIKLEGEDQYKNHYRISLPWPGQLENSMEFSTNPDQNLNQLIHWHDRVDAYVENNKFHLLIYRKPDQLGYFQDGSKWFDDDFRELVHQKAREQGKLPPSNPEPDK